MRRLRRRGRLRPLWHVIPHSTIISATLLLLFLPEALPCLSNPSLPCSVASSAPACQPANQYIQPPKTSYQRDDVYSTGRYHGFLGEKVEARAYSEVAPSSQFALADVELQCTNVTHCTWRNDREDQLDWVSGSGDVAPAKLNIITGSSIMPEESFLILASDRMPAAYSGSLISRPIACQPASGLLSFRYWRSRARTLGQEPDLDVCTRLIPDTTLDNCLTIETTENHTILASIPPMMQPFEIVIRGYGFENEPEGGLIILDSIDYFAHLESAENCAVREDNTIPPNAIDTASTSPISQSTAPSTTSAPAILSSSTSSTSTAPVVFFKPPSVSMTMRSGRKDVLSRDVRKNDNEVNKEIILVSQEDSEGSCRSLECNLEEQNDEGCLYRRVGTGAKGEGFRVGWKVAHVSASPSNPLTGIHRPPEGTEPNFLVADFPGFVKSRREHRYVLESPEFLLEDNVDAYISFQKYMATQGIELLVCADWKGTQCFWDAFQNSADPFARRWTKEVLKIPSNINKFFIICTQDASSRANVGQVGLSSIGLFSDAEATIAFC